MWKMQRYEQNVTIRGAIRQRAMPVHSIDRSLEDKPLGGCKKIVITATIAVDRRGIKEKEKKRERERERAREGDEKKKRNGEARDQPSASSCLVEIFSLPQRLNASFYWNKFHSNAS